MKPQGRRRLQGFPFALLTEPLWRVESRVGVRAGPIADKDQADRQTLRAGLGNQATTTEAFIIWMGGDDHDPMASNNLLQRENRQRSCVAQKINCFQGSPQGVGIALGRQHIFGSPGEGEIG